MNCIIEGGINDCYWNNEKRCTSYEVTLGKKTGFSRDWDSKQNCTLTQIGVHLCGAYLPQGKEESRSKHSYQCGDNCKGECSGEVDGTPRCSQSDRDKVLDGDWVRDKFFEWVNSRERPPSLYACEQQWKKLVELRQKAGERG
jgi:hypothetical protein